MLKLILSTDWVSGRNEILRYISEDVAHGKGNRILMVPELISHDMERRLCLTAGDTVSRFAEVLSFTRLARRVFSELGAGTQECLDNGGRVVAMAAAARQLHSRLKAYASVETRPEFLMGLVDAVDEFKRCCILPADLKLAAKNTQGAFAQKLEELSMLLETYDALCARGKRDPRDQMTLLLDILPDSNFTEQHTFYVDGFPDFTRQNMAILEYMVQTSPLVVVSLNCDKPGSSNPGFEKAGETAAQLIRYAKTLEIDYEIVYHAPEESPLSYLRENLFHGSVQRFEPLREELRVLRCDSTYKECQAATQTVMDLVRQGCRYRDIGIVCTNIATYRDTISLIFNRCGIPVYLSGTEDILQKSVVSTVLAAMDAALRGFEREDVLRYLKSALSPLDKDTCDQIENYATVWAVSGRRWLQRWENHPDGLSGSWSEETDRQLAALNKAREAAVTPLIRLQQSFRNPGNLCIQVTALYRFFEDIHLAQHLSDLAEEMDAAGENREAQILNQLWDILLSALEQLYDVLGETAWDSEHFTRLFTLLLSQYDVGTIPPVLDSVSVGPVSAMRCQEVSHLILLGAQEGALPGYCGSTGILTDQERSALREMGVPLTGGGMEGLQAEFAEIYGVFCGARKSVTICCSSTQPSFIYRRLAVMAGEIADVGLIGLYTDSMDAAAYLAAYQAKEAADALGIGNAYQDVKRYADYEMGHISAAAVRKLYGKKLRLSASQVDKQAECRLSYFLNYGLRAKERREATVDPMEFGSYVHWVLEHTGQKVMEFGGFHKVSLEQTLSIAMEFSEQYTDQRFGQLDSERLTYLFRRNIRELAMVVEELWMELSSTDFTPVAFELDFGENCTLPAIDIPDTQIPAQLRGYVDRVDAWFSGHNHYFRVVDYKTGKKDFDYCDVFNGIGLQMLLYLFTLESQNSNVLGSNAKSAGVLYFPARSGILSADGKLSPAEANNQRAKEWKRKGLLLANTDVISAMEPEGCPQRLCCKTDKDGNLIGDIATRQQMNQLRDYMFLVLRKLVGEIAQGNVDPNPYTRGTQHSACTYCPYKAVCHFDRVPGRRNYKAMSAQRFWEEIGKEMHRHG